MRVLFFYPDIVDAYEQPLGIMFCSAVLKQHGHQTELFDFTHLPRRRGTNLWNHEIGRRDFLTHLERFRPDLVAMGVVSPYLEVCVSYAKLLKSRYPGIPLVMGGPHPTTDAENAIAIPEFDAIVLGEGELAFAEYVERLAAGRATDDVPSNVWMKRNGQVVRGTGVKMVKDLDALPVPDRDLIDHHLKAGLPGISFITSRGCPYHCTYCHNPFLQDLYAGQGRYVRYRSVPGVIQEIKDALRRYPHIGEISFSDDMFTAMQDRAKELCRAYQREIGLPFVCQTHVDFLDDEMIVALKEAGCVRVNMGIEAGNEAIRYEILKRPVKRQKIVDVFRKAHEVGLACGSYNILGSPGETEATIWETIELNRDAGSEYVHATVFAPFKGTPLRKEFEAKGWMTGEPDEDYYHGCVIRLPTLSPAKLKSYNRTFSLYVFQPRWTYPFIHALRLMWEHFPRATNWLVRAYQKALFTLRPGRNLKKRSDGPPAPPPVKASQLELAG